MRSRRCWFVIVAALLAAIALPLFAQASSAAAHPLGNFTINRYSRIELGPDSIHLRYVLDMAEIPAFQERDAIDSSGDGSFSGPETAAYLAKKADVLRRDIDLRVDGVAIELSTLDSSLSFPAGEGGIDTQRVEIDFSGAVPNASMYSLEYHDNNYTDRIGWREIVVRALDGVRIASSTAPSQDVSNELRAYPLEDSLVPPPNTTGASASYRIAPGAIAAAETTTLTEQEQAVHGNPDSPLVRYSGLIAKDRLSASVVIFALLAAVGFGALHALSPGHGKTIVAAYLVGSGGTWRHALLLALTVTVTHTSSVYALGFVALYLSHYVVPEELYPWLSIGSGALIAAMGLGLLLARLRTSELLTDAMTWLRLRPRLAIASENGAMVLPASGNVQKAPGHDHPHDHDAAVHAHGIGPAHSHVLPGQNGEKVSWRGLIGLGIFGGLLPCPSAIVVMLSAIALHRIAFGMLLIVAFSVGLAGVLTGLGFALVFAGAISRRLPLVALAQTRFASMGNVASFAVRAFPVAAASAVFGAGMFVLLRALAQQGAI